MTHVTNELAYDALCKLCDNENVPQGCRPEARALLGDLLIARADPCPEPALLAIDKVLVAEKRAALKPTPETLTDAQWLSIGDTKLAVWQGDIRHLAVGAVVNAANEQGLGCFQPSHRCIDNVLHRAAGPRLREECRALMMRRGPLVAGAPPLLTAGYHLNAAHVLHVTGPALEPAGRQPRPDEQAALAACYTGCLDAAAAAGIRSVAFCCISTGLFGYPSEAAAAVALSSVVRWLHAHPGASFDALVFDVFTDRDAAAYAAALPLLAAGLAQLEPPAAAPAVAPAAGAAPLGGEEAQVAEAIAGCDKLLIVAAAGLSISLDAPNNPYHSRADFRRHYPAVAAYGYRTSYEAMGLSRDERVPRAVRVAHMAQHFLNMRFRFPPTDGYAHLRALAASFGDESTFVWTSNVDGAFERAGFAPRHVYQTQGEMKRLQCARSGCGHVWDCVAQLRAIDAASPDGVLTDLSLAPRCPQCGHEVYLPNLRGGDWFDPAPYAEAGRELEAWLDACVAQKSRVAIVEVGVGPNTPVVTRIPACAFASSLAAAGGRPVYLRVNPDPPEHPNENPADGVPFYRWRQPWTALKPLAEAVVALRDAGRDEADAPEPPPPEPRERKYWQERYRGMLTSLRRSPK